MQVKAGRWIMREGEVAESVFIVAGGRVEVVDERPPETLIRVLRRGDCARRARAAAGRHAVGLGTRAAGHRAAGAAPCRLRGADQPGAELRARPDARDGGPAGGEPHARRLRPGAAHDRGGRARRRRPRRRTSPPSWRRRSNGTGRWRAWTAASWRRSTRPSGTPTASFCVREPTRTTRGHVPACTRATS